MSTAMNGETKFVIPVILWTELCPPQNLYVEALTSNVTVWK